MGFTIGIKIKSQSAPIIGALFLCFIVSYQIYGNEKEATPIVTGTASLICFQPKRLNYILGLWITSFHPYRHPFRPEAS